MRVPARLKSILTLTLALILTASPLVPLAQAAEEKTVRVGWFDSSMCYRDKFGRRCGIDYEYQQRISAYTGWTYEYVEDSWPNLLQMLKDGKLDLLSDVSYTEERAAQILYPDLPMGSESYYIYIDAQNRTLSADDLASFSGTRIGVNASSVQEGYLRDWVEHSGVAATVVPLTTPEDESLNMVTRGELDGFVSIYQFSTKQAVVPILRVGASDYYYAVNKARPDLLAELNAALAGIRDNDPFFAEQLNANRLLSTRTDAYLTPTQADWLAAHGAIRVGYREDSMPFCQTDKASGKLTGALKDYLAHAVNNLQGTNVRFETVPFASTKEALDAMKAGEVDCVFPVCLNLYDADAHDVRVTNAAMNTSMSAVMRDGEAHDLSHDTTITFAVAAGDLNVAAFIMDRYPDAARRTYDTARECFAAVATGEADCLLLSSYRIPALEPSMEKLKLYSVPTGESMPFSFAVNKAERGLFLLLDKTVVMTDSEEMASSLASYMRFTQRVTFGSFLRDNWVYVLLTVCAVFGVIVVLLLQKLKAERRANEQQRLLDEANEIAELEQTISSLLNNIPALTFTKDAATGVYLACNQSFAEYAHKASPEGVVGLTDAEIFDAKTAARFVADDQITASMDEPYIFFEDTRDAAGDARQFQTTKLKYTDTRGRQCILGICQDMTDMVRIRREHAETKEAYEQARSSSLIYIHIAQALAGSYNDLYYINLDTEGYIEYRPDADGGGLTEVRRGWHFFEQCRIEAEETVLAEDRGAVLKALERHALVAALERDRALVLTYRVLTESGARYVTMKATRMTDDERCVVLGITDVDDEMKHRSMMQRVEEEKIAYNRLSALAGDYLCIYLVVPESGRYREFSSARGYDYFGQPKTGMDFFTESRENGRKFCHRDDVNRFLASFSREAVLSEIERRGIFTLSYRLMVDGLPRYVQLKAAKVEEPEGARIIVGVSDIDDQVRQEEEYVRHLAKARIEASVDALTGVKNRHAYLMAEERLNTQLEDDDALEFAVVILDVNDLKKVNDNEGHKAGDLLLQNACKIVCDVFKHSPVFRVGGDEFAVLAQGSDYENIDELVARVAEHNLAALRSGGIVVACGMAKREGDAVVDTVFERADEAMYRNKSDLKERRNRGV